MKEDDLLYLILEDERMQSNYIPPTSKQTIDDYVNHRCEPGHFITAVLENSLSGAFGAADEHNRKHLFGIVKYVYNNVPHTLWGSREKVEKHLKGE